MTPKTLPAPVALGLFAAVYVLYIGVSLFVPSSLVGLVILEVVALGIPTALFVRANGVPLADGLGLRKPRPLAWLGAALIGASFWYPNLWLVNILVDDPNKLREVERSLGWTAEPWLAKLLAIAIVPAICEELLMRGAIARGLRPRTGIVAAVLISSLLFASLHLPPVRMIPAGMFGLVLGYAAIATDSVFPCVLMHFLNNLIAGVLPEAFDFLVASPGWTALGTASATVLGLWLLARSRAPDVPSAIEQIPS